MSQAHFSITRRRMMAGTATMMASIGSATAQKFGPPEHKKGPLVYLDYDQVELDAAYDQNVYEPSIVQIRARLTSNSMAARRRIGEPRKTAYGTSEIETLDIFRTTKNPAPVIVFIHGGEWQRGRASDYSFLAEMFLNAGAHCVIPDFVWIQDAGGSLMPLARQVSSAIAWAWRNALSFGGDPGRFYVAGHSSGGHLAAVALTADWKKEFGLDPGFIKGGVCISGMYDLKPCGCRHAVLTSNSPMRLRPNSAHSGTSIDCTRR